MIESFIGSEPKRSKVARQTSEPKLATEPLIMSEPKRQIETCDKSEPYSPTETVKGSEPSVRTESAAVSAPTWFDRYMQKIMNGRANIRFFTLHNTANKIIKIHETKSSNRS
jgi:hypothetical protein